MLRKHLPFALVLSLILFSAMVSTGDAASYWKTLSATYPATAIPLNSICMTSQTSGCTVGEDGNIFITSDRGKTWTAGILAPVLAVDFDKVHFPSANVGYAVGTQPGGVPEVWKTTNGGANWARIKAFPAGSIQSVFFFNDNTGWVCGSDLGVGGTGAVAYTTDGGTSWNAIKWDAAVAGIANDIYFLSATTGVVACDTDSLNNVKILLSSNGGQNWAAAGTGGATTYNMKAMGIYGTLGLAVGPEGRFMRSIDSGSNWSLGSSGFSGNLKGVSLADGSNAWAVTKDSIIRTTNGGSTWTAASTGYVATSLGVMSAVPAINGIDFVDEYNGWICGNDSDGDPIVYKWVVDPTISAINQVAIPAATTVPQGFTGDIKITGTNFQPNPAVACGASITVNSVTLNSSTQLTVNITVTASATPGARTVTVTNPDTGTVSYTGFAVTALPTITSTQYSSRYQGWGGAFAVNGTGFLTGVNANFGTGVSVLSSSLTGSTNVSFVIQIAADAPTGPRNIRIYNSDGGTATATLDVLVQNSPPILFNVKFNGVPYVQPTALYPTPEVSVNPPVEFDFAATGGVSPDAFRAYVINSAGYTEIAIPSSYYSSTTGKVNIPSTSGIGPLTAGDQTILFTGADLAGQGASYTCNVWVRNPSSADRSTIRSIIGYPNPWNPNSDPLITFQMQSQADFPGSKFIILDSSGQILYQQAIDMTAGKNEIKWNGNGGFSRQVPTGMLNTLVLDSTGARKFQGKLGVYHR